MRRPLPKLDADIVLSPGGYRGVYTLGICHYVKNHFDVKDKTFAGFSSGSFNGLFMVIDKEYNNQFLNHLFCIKKCSIERLLTNVTHVISDNFKKEQFELERLHVAVSTPDGLEYFKDFLTLQDVLSCCTCSSFVPMVTCHDIFMFYRSKLTLDGGVFYRDVKKQEKEKLIIHPSMFGRYKPNRTAGFYQPKTSTYQMYLNGYHDARKNHAYFEQFFKETPTLVHTPPS